MGSEIGATDCWPMSGFGGCSVWNSTQDLISMKFKD